MLLGLTLPMWTGRMVMDGCDPGLTNTVTEALEERRSLRYVTVNKYL